MKRRNLLLTFLCLVVAGRLPGGSAAEPDRAPAVARPVRFIVGLSPFLAASDKDQVYRGLVGFLLEDVPVGSALWLYDAYRLQTIAQIDVPEVRAFRSAKIRANQFKEPIQKLKTFLAASPDPPSVRGLDFAQAVRLPLFLDFVGANLLRADADGVVIVLGSPLYVDDKEPGFCMVNGYFPSDGHLVAGRESSVFSLDHREKALTGAAVHLGWFGDPWVSEVHQEKILRFWSLYLDGQGARLGAFCGDLPTLLATVRRGSAGRASRERSFAIDPAQTKVEMLRITREVGVDDWITRDVLLDRTPEPPVGTVGAMKIGIRWQRDLDIDLYARARPEAETLFFEHTRCPEGYYFKDHRSSPDREYEFIEFERPVNIWEVEAQINFYEGRAPGGATGEIRIEFDRTIYSGTFALQAEHGNRGRSGRTQFRYWTEIDVPGILGLRGSERHASRR